MATTYSLSLTGVRADYIDPYNVSTLQVPDQDATGTNCLRDGGISVVGVNNLTYSANVARLGNQLLCKNPDGSQSWYTIDNELSRPGKLVLNAVRP